MSRFIPVLVALLGACTPPQPAPRQTKAELIEETIAARTADYLASYRRRCRQDALDLAEAAVDSILLARAFGDRDTTGRPPRPIKPDRPEPLRPRDSIGWVAPILER